MNTLTKDEFNALSIHEQADYINYFAKKYAGREFLYLTGLGNYNDVDDPESGHIDNLFDYALELHYEATDLQGKLFLD